MKFDQLVSVVHGEPLASTETIAKGMKVGHKSVIQLVRKHSPSLASLGTLAFEMRKSGGRPMRPLVDLAGLKSKLQA